jgi:hypothetical protein
MHASPRGRQTACLPACHAAAAALTCGVEVQNEGILLRLAKLHHHPLRAVIRAHQLQGRRGGQGTGGRQAGDQAGSEAGRAVGQGKTHASSCHEPLHVLSNPVAHVALGNYQHRS